MFNWQKSAKSGRPHLNPLGTNTSKNKYQYVDINQKAQFSTLNSLNRIIKIL